MSVYRIDVSLTYEDYRIIYGLVGGHQNRTRIAMCRYDRQTHGLWLVYRGRTEALKQVLHVLDVLTAEGFRAIRRLH